ncbi:EutN/CcmL family microcompartment protein [bacterium]|nr:EutN/CcmL family microcompartment protein [bacterium]
MKNTCYDGFKILLVEILDLQGKGTGREFLAVDAVDAGIDDIVLLCMEGGAVSVVMEVPKAACDAAIVGVIDTINIDER